MMALSEADIRPAVIKQASMQGRRGSDAVIIPELDLRGLARADVALVDGRMIGWEIKSDRDSLRRLPNQVVVYSRVFDMVHLVVTERHRRDGQRMVPDWWGVDLASAGVTGDVVITELRRARWNRAVDELMVTGLLWKTDMVGLLRARGVRGRLRGQSIHQLKRRVLAEVPFPEIRERVRLRLAKGQGARRGIVVPQAEQATLDRVV